MTIRSILHFPDPRLRNKAVPVENIDDDIKTLVADMFETMYHERGIGLAATQINVALRVIVIDCSEDKSQQLCLINPKITWKDGVEEMDEGCLSVPGIYEKVQRADRIKVEALDAQGKPFELETGGLLAVCVQHEIDHLDGKLFVDYLSPIKRQWIQKKMQKLRRKTL